MFIIGGNHTNLNLWPNYFQNQTNPPLGLIVVSIGNPGPMMKQVGTWTVPYDAGNPVDTEVDLRFSPVAGRYVQIQLQTNVTWGVELLAGLRCWPAQPPAPANLTWNVGEVELYGFTVDRSRISMPWFVIVLQIPCQDQLRATAPANCRLGFELLSGRTYRHSASDYYLFSNQPVSRKDLQNRGFEARSRRITTR